MSPRADAEPDFNEPDPEDDDTTDATAVGWPDAGPRKAKAKRRMPGSPNPIASTSMPRPAWMSDTSLLPKHPPKARRSIVSDED